MKKEHLITFKNRQSARDFVWNFKNYYKNDSFNIEIIDRGIVYTWKEFGGDLRKTENPAMAKAMGATLQDRWMVKITPIIHKPTKTTFVLSVPTRKEARQFIKRQEQSDVYTGRYKLVDLGYNEGDYYRWCVIQEIEQEFDIFEQIANKFKSLFKSKGNK